MANDGDKARMELEIALKDSVSTALKTIGRELDAMNKKSQEVGNAGTAAFTAFRRQTTLQSSRA